MPKASTKKVKELAGRLKRSERTIWRWVAEGCDLASERSIRAFAEGKQLRRTNVQRARERREAFGVSDGSGSQTSGDPDFERSFPQNSEGNNRATFFSGGLPPPGPRGAAAALKRLEKAEERSHGPLLKATET